MAGASDQDAMIRCLIAGRPGHLVMRLPCPIHRGDKRNKQLALKVINRDRKCWACGTTDRLEAAHIIAKANGGPDSLENLRAECKSRNRTGECGRMVK